jgi:hypothetical protein
VSNKRKMENRAVTYLKPSYKKLLNNYADVNEISRSEALEIAVKNMFDTMPKEQKIQYLNSSKPVKE